MICNIYGIPLDRNGYAPSIMQTNTDECFLTGARGDLVRHECIHGAYRQKSKRLGLWVMLAAEEHMRLHQRSPETDRQLKVIAQLMAMEHYGWSTDDFRAQFGKSYLGGIET